MGGAFLKEITRSFNCSDINQLDIQALRAAFSDLMDEAAGAVHAAGLEQDDCILERLADVRLADGTVMTIEVDMLSNRELCVRRLLVQCPAANAIVALRLRVIRGPSLDPFGLAPT